MPFVEGKSGNEHGRPKQTTEQAEQKKQFKALLKEATIPALNSILAIARDTKSRDCLNACKYIVDKAYGMNTAFLSDEEAEPINIRIIRCNANGEQEWNTNGWD